MPGNMAAIGRVNPNPVAAGDQCGLNHVAHAVQCLELEASGGNLCHLGGRDRMGQAADVVAAKGRAELLMMLDQEPGATLEHRVTLPFLKEDRLGPAEPPGGQDLVVPVGPLDQPDRDRRAPRFDPLQQRTQLGLGLRLIGLDHDADIRPVAELGLGKNPPEKRIGEGAVRILFHVNMNIGAQLAGRSKNRPQPAGHTHERGLGMDRVEMGGQARQLE